MFNFTASSEAVTTTALSEMDQGTPSIKYLFGDWYALCVPN